MPRSYHSTTQVRRPSTPPPHALSTVEGQSSTAAAGTNTNPPMTFQAPTRESSSLSYLYTTCLAVHSNEILRCWVEAPIELEHY